MPIPRRLRKGAGRLTAAIVLIASASEVGAQGLSLEDSLKATHQTLMQAVGAASAERVSALIHPRALGFFRDSQRVVQLQGGDLTVVVQGLLKDLGEITTSQQPLDTSLRVIGETGIVTQTTMRESVVSKRKVVRYLRTTAVYLRTPDGWKLASWHTSDTPLEK